LLLARLFLCQIYKNKNKMAKTTSSGDTKKISFGTKKRGKAKKSFNKSTHY